MSVMRVHALCTHSLHCLLSPISVLCKTQIDFESELTLNFSLGQNDVAALLDLDLQPTV
jgi:hypothetical protein